MPFSTRFRRTSSRKITPIAAVSIGSADVNCGERALEPRHMPRLVDQPPSPHLADLVDTVAELEGAILDVHRRLAKRHVAAIDVGDAGHVQDRQ